MWVSMLYSIFMYIYTIDYTIYTFTLFDIEGDAGDKEKTQRKTMKIRTQYWTMKKKKNEKEEQKHLRRHRTYIKETEEDIYKYRRIYIYKYASAYIYIAI